ncbi:MAG: response regulator [Deltaproteobacteria bacterium]|nr:response regulator [Deltaproteobacteria bacterium]
MRALVADDSNTMRMVLRDILQSMGLDVDCVEDGEAALELLGTVSYEIVLLDWNMPKMLGIDVMKAVRREGNTVPIIVVTTEGQKRNILEAVKAGANDYVTKPFVKETIVTRVGRLLKSTQ